MFLSAVMLFRLPPEQSIMFCSQNSMDFLMHSLKLFQLFHILTKWLQGPKNHMAQFITAMAALLCTNFCLDFFSCCCDYPNSPQSPPNLLPTGSPLLITMPSPQFQRRHTAGSGQTGHQNSRFSTPVEDPQLDKRPPQLPEL